MDITNLKKVHLIGVGGINVSAIARLLVSYNVEVSGSDLIDSDITEELKSEGVEIIKNHDKKNITGDTNLVVYSDAVPQNNEERVAAKEKGIRQASAFEFWGEYAKDKKVIAVSGTNGKSTTTAMIGLIMEKAGMDPTVVVGTKVSEWKSNIRIGNSNWLVVEADEFSAHMLEFKPYIAVITNIEPDHLDYYKDIDDIVGHFQKWLDASDNCVGLVLNADDKNIAKLKIKNKDARIFSLQNSEKINLPIPGAHNLANALAALEVASMLKIEKKTAKDVLEGFAGAWRRFEKVGSFNNQIVISDYAHHPSAVKLTIEATKQKYPNKKILVLFQPHHHNRTKNLFNDFVNCFSGADKLIISEIYDVVGRDNLDDLEISSKNLVAAISEKENMDINFAENLESAENMIRKLVDKDYVILIMGAGDVDKVARNLVKK